MLLDTHALYWLVSGAKRLTDEALIAIGESQAAGVLLVSPISSWELSVAAQKPPSNQRPDLGGTEPEAWFRDAVAVTQARIAPVWQKIALEAAAVAAATGHRDPGDCFLIATARVKRVPLITRDTAVRAIARENPGYLSIIVC